MAVTLIRVLLIEGNPSDARLVREHLSEAGPRFALSHLATLAEACAWLAHNACDAVLLDLSLPDAQGPDAIARLRAAAPAVAVVVLTGQDDEDMAEMALSAGCQDFLVKSRLVNRFDADGLQRSLRYAVRRQVLENSLLQSEQRLHGILTHGLAQQAIVVLDESRRITIFNPAAERLFGYQADQMIGQPLDALIPERSLERHNRHFSGFAGKTSETSRTMTCRPAIMACHANGYEFPVEVLIAQFEVAGSRLFTAVVRDISEQLRMATELRRLATTDPLTGVPNRNRFLDLVFSEFQRYRRHQHPVAVMIIDIDHFKSINDSHGHSAGDAALVALAGYCGQMLRVTDAFGRMGGEEFAAILPDTGIDGALEVAERLRSFIANMDIPCLTGTFRITISIGLSLCRPGDRDTEPVMTRANQALNRARVAGCDRVEIASGD
ncbi:Diguanylate cyclase [uncultured Gammaproteobacteria bacterium]